MISQLCNCDLYGVSPNGIDGELDGASDADAENEAFDVPEARPHQLKRKPDELFRYHTWRAEDGHRAHSHTVVRCRRHECGRA